MFNLAGVNRPENPEDFMRGNFGFASELLNSLKNTIIRRLLCYQAPFRQPCLDALETVSMGVAKGR